MSSLTMQTQKTLSAAGWFPERRVDTGLWRTRFAETGLQMHAAAEAFLAEFDGLTLAYHGAGITRAREPFELDPLLVWNSEEGRFLEWSETLGHDLFPVGELDHGRFFLGLDEHAELYVVETWIATFGQMPTAMDKLVLGVMPQRVTEG